MQACGHQDVLQGEVPVHNGHVVQLLHALDHLPRQGPHERFALGAWRHGEALLAPPEHVPLGGQVRHDICVSLAPVDAEEIATVLVPHLVQEAIATDVLPRELGLAGVGLDKVGVGPAHPLVGHPLHGDELVFLLVPHQEDLATVPHRVLYLAQQLEAVGIHGLDFLRVERGVKWIGSPRRSSGRLLQVQDLLHGAPLAWCLGFLRVAGSSRLRENPAGKQRLRGLVARSPRRLGGLPATRVAASCPSFSYLLASAAVVTRRCDVTLGLLRLTANHLLLLPKVLQVLQVLRAGRDDARDAGRELQQERSPALRKVVHGDRAHEGAALSDQSDDVKVTATTSKDCSQF
mmetsp:Transcript_15453/g.46372  ORF Transcript_15453/g.46372 Transcript_15453/m.46372 type:complete len:347 (+) Transcript_15453:657-1697(+)